MPTPEIRLPETTLKLPRIAHEYKTAIHRHSSSTSQSNPLDYENLACLGNTALTYAVTFILFKHPLIRRPGDITEARKAFVCQETVAKWGELFQFDQKVEVAKHMLPLSEEQKRSFACATFNAFLGALSQVGQEILIEFVEKLMAPSIGEVIKSVQVHPPTVNKMAMQLLHQKLAKAKIPLPTYPFEDAGEGVDPRFECKCLIGEKVVGKGSGRTKRDAQQRAAEQALRWLAKEK